MNRLTAFLRLMAAVCLPTLLSAGPIQPTTVEPGPDDHYTVVRHLDPDLLKRHQSARRRLSVP